MGVVPGLGQPDLHRAGDSFGQRVGTCQELGVRGADDHRRGAIDFSPGDRPREPAASSASRDAGSRPGPWRHSADGGAASRHRTTFSVWRSASGARFGFSRRLLDELLQKGHPPLAGDRTRLDEGLHAVTPGRGSGAVSISTSDATRAGWARANRSATMPPKLCPSRSQRGTSQASSRVARSPTSCSKVKVSTRPVFVKSPWPRRSGASRRPLPASSGSWLREVVAVAREPVEEHQGPPGARHFVEREGAVSDGDPIRVHLTSGIAPAG